MNEIRYGAAAAMFEGDDSIWWITGGSNDESYLNSTEFFNVNDNSFTFRVNLPNQLFHHNLVNVNNTHMVLLGGFSYNGGEVFIINR